MQVRLLGILIIGVICSLIACSGGGSAMSPQSGSATIVLGVTPSVTEVATGDSLPVSATISGTTDTNVTWTVDGIPNGNASVGTITGTGQNVTYQAPDAEGSHVLTVISVADSSKSAQANIHVKFANKIIGVTLSPGSTSLQVGTSQAFTASVTNTPNTGVTWTVDGVAEGNSTVGLLTGSGSTRTYLAPSAAGSHVLMAASVADPTKTASSKITVELAPPVVSVSLNPVSSTLNTGGTASFTATVSGTSTTTVTWSVDGVANGNATTGQVSGSGNTITYTAPATVGTHSLMATSTADPTKAASATLTVQAQPATVGVTLSPVTTTLFTGATASFTATVSGSSTSTVAWTVDGISNGNGTVGTLSGTGNTVTYTAPAAAGTHTLTATSTADTTKAASSTITVQTPSVPPVSVSLSPGSTTLNTGATATFTATVTGPPITTVTWTVDSIANGNATVGTLSGSGNTVTYTAPASAGTHTLTATSTADPTKSSNSAITVQAASPAVGVSLNPSSTTLNTGATASFTASVSGSTTTTVSWAVDGVANGNGTVGTLSGTGNTVTYTAPAAAGTHTLTATSTADATKSASATITVQTPPVPPVSVSLSPSTTTLNAGATAAFTASVTGSATTTVTWTVDSIANGNATVGTVSGSGNTATYTAPATTGTHTLTATSTADPTQSSSATITVQAAPAPVVVTMTPSTSTLTVSTTTSFTASVSGSTNTAVTWTVDGVTNGNSTVGTITGTGATVTYTAPASAGSHTVKATSSADSTKYASSTITVQTAPTPVSVSLNPTATTLNTSGTASFTATVSGSTNSSVNWTVDSVANGNSTVGTVSGSGVTITYTAPASAGSHTLVATSLADGTKSASASITVQAPVITISMSPTSATVAGGAGQLFTATVSGSTNTGTNWTVDGVANGNATVGTLTGSGTSRTYTAPSAAGTHNIAATSAADGTKVASATVTVQAAPTGIIVAPNGVAGNPGTLASPTTIDGARTLVQNASRATAGTIRVLLRGGVYPRTSSIAMSSSDSGSAANPVVWDAYPGETPRIIGGVSISASSARIVDGSDPNWSRLDPAARPYIYVVDLSAYQSSIGTLSSRSSETNQSMEVFVDGAPLTLARYPKAVDPSAATIAPHSTIRVTGTLSPDVTGDYAYKGLDSRGRPYYQLSKNGNLWSLAGSATSADWRLSDRKDLGGNGSGATWGVWDTFAGPAGAFAPLSGASGTALLAPADGSLAVPGFLLIRGTNGTTQITAPDSHMSKWRAAEAMYYGLGYYSWSGSHSALSSLDAGTGTMVLASQPTYGLRLGQPFFIYNLLEELTAPGECFIDRTNAKLYMRPAGDVAPSDILISTLQSPILQMTSCQQVTWQGITFEAAKDRLVFARDCQSVTFNKCTFRNSGGYAMLLSGYSNTVEACDFRYMGQGGIYVCGGNRATLTPANTLIENCEFQRFGRLFWTYQPAINIQSFNDYSWNSDAMGITVQHNEIHHTPHAAILFSGNANVFKYNIIHDATQWTNDAGVIYTTGREWGTQGNLIQFNLIRNCGSQLGVYLSGIYIDGVGSGVKIEGNILYQVAPMFAIQHNGGRDVVTQYNIFSGHWYGMDISNVAFEVVNNTAGSSWNLLEKLQHFNYQAAPWSTAYPNVAQIPNTWAQLQGTHWLEPEGSACYGNLQQGSSTNIYVQHNYNTALAAPTNYFSKVGSNLTQDPLFTDPANLNFALQPGSPMYSIPGFPGIDTTQMGIQR